ncbi:MAG TPA: hypothetical protein VKR59_15750 [Terriglobales bacterium]|nr:hypothetical protein [Terriglobales bacterium]
MKRSHSFNSRSFKSRRVLAVVALFGAMITTMLTPASAQQEVDPTWYNPWVSSSVSSSTAAVQTTQPMATDQAHKAKIKTVSHQASNHTSNHTAKNASKRVVTQTKPS